LEGIIGQARAVSALHFGLSIQEIGFHVYVAGPPGSGKMRAIWTFLEEVAQRKAPPPDWCYVYNFDDPYQPTACPLPAGQGRQFQQDMRHLIEYISREVPKAFESDEYGTKQGEIGKALDRQRSQVLEHLSERAKQAGFALQAMPYGLMLVPVIEGHPMSDAELQSLSAAAREELQQRHEALQDELKASLKQIREIERAARDQLQALDRQVVQYLVSGLIEDLTEKYRGIAEVISYLTAVERDILEHIEPFKTSSSSPATPSPQGFPTPPSLPQDVPFRKYTVNVLVDRSKQVGAPVVIEFHPSYNTLFGRLEKEPQFGALYTDFTMIKAGAFHHANGGYLVLPAEDVVRDPASWEGVKRALHSRAIQIEELGERLGFPAIKSLRPQPIPLDVKVLLVGRPQLYAQLQSYDEEFPELFKVKADFDTRMACNDENIGDFLRFVCTLCCKEGLSHMDSSAVAKILEQAMRLAEDQTKLSTQFGTLADLIREAHFWAQHENVSVVSAVHVRQAIEAKVLRVNLVEEHVQEMITRGTLCIDTAGHTVGQVNGLSVISLGDYLFGRPSRITASVSPGREGIIDIEREVSLGGPLHSKGMLIVSGYLAHQYAQDKPLTLAARLVFEQSYEGVEGDSASAAELYALLSALSGSPIRQGIAVTGSVNQHGEVQAIGGVNQKIEGFFDVCKAKGLTGEQGVLIPHSNVPHLMLREDVVDAVRAQQFHVWAVRTIDEGMEILMGMPAGVRDADCHFAAGTLNARIDQRLREFVECLKAFQAAGVAEAHR
jgi:lon-related putative ATP-dependent protease